MEIEENQLSSDSDNIRFYSDQNSLELNGCNDNRLNELIEGTNFSLNDTSSLFYNQSQENAYLEMLNVYDKYDHIFKRFYEDQLSKDIQEEEDEGRNNQTLEEKTHSSQVQIIKRACIQQNYNLDTIGFDRMKLLTGLTLMKDGTLRLCAVLGSVSFNYQQQLVECVEDKHKLGVIDLHYGQNSIIKEHSLEDALQYLGRINIRDYIQTEFQLKRFYNLMQSMRVKMRSLSLTQQELDEKDDQFEDFLKYCYEYIDTTYNQNPENSSKMYWYQIGRVNFREREQEIVRTGFSKSYLELLGINNSSLNTIYMRKQQVDLIKEKNLITNQTLQAMDQKFQNLSVNQQVVFITTFDGFPLTLIQNKLYVPSPFKKQTLTHEYMFVIIELDMDLEDLQKLIEYRQNIVKTPENLTLDEFIQKELSYRFEDVEYSIHSQTFMEKFYLENLQKMRHLEEQLIKQKEEKKPCGYKFIHKPQIQEQIRPTVTKA